MRIRPYTEADAAAWDGWVDQAACGTFLHMRRFLSYHGRRFTDRSLVCEDGKGRIAGVFPAALKPDEPACVVSHPGATYGGLLHRAASGAGEVEEMLAGVIEHYRSQGLARLEYKSVPPHLHSTFSQADVHAVWKRGAEIARRDLWGVVSLGDAPRWSTHHQREIARAQKKDTKVCIEDSDDAYRQFHGVLEACLVERHGVAPVHSREEMIDLRDRFPRDIALWLGRNGSGGVLAGCWVFMFATRAWHTQYIASTPQGRERGATYLVLDGLLREAVRNRVAFLSFGSSTEDGGRRLNSGLHDFKAGFGADAVCHDIYNLVLA